MKIIAYCMDWHINRSDAFRDLLEVPLSKWSTVEFHGWNGINVKLPKDDKIPLIFCMLPPSEDVLNIKGFLS